ncbi:hypothetical protein BELL_0720g00020 [Botrytis elliptica]|uniref:Uncharacterized protein n=1 Tax=Botrytis elliptica TaxID=278938 RepID=A0A4Z1JA98_9HELO|nr:hypothetical protein BELL_0720g00020 [Botrytis elliptica]
MEGLASSSDPPVPAFPLARWGSECPRFPATPLTFRRFSSAGNIHFLGTSAFTDWELVDRLKSTC